MHTREIKNRDRCNEQVFNFLHLSTTTSAASFLFHFQPKGSEKPNGKHPCEGLISKCQNSPKQRRRLLMRALDNITVSPGQDAGAFFARIYQSLGELIVHIGAVILDKRLTDIVIESVTNHVQIKYDTKRDPDFSIGGVKSAVLAPTTSTDINARLPSSPIQPLRPYHRTTTVNKFQHPRLQQ